MTEQNPVTGQPYGGRDEKPDDGPLPGERPESETVGAPDTDQQHDTGSRAAQGGPMAGSDDAGDGPQPSPGIPEQVDAPSPSGASDADPPGGSAANQSGRAPDQ